MLEAILKSTVIYRISEIKKKEKMTKSIESEFLDGR